MFNPFKKSFLIEKIEKLSGKPFYTVEYGNWWFHDYITSYGCVSVHYNESFCSFYSLEDAKDAIERFWAQKLEKRFSQSATTQSFKI